MALPAEIRLMILREVLSREVPLFGRETYMMPKRKQKSKTSVKSKKEATRKSLPRAAKSERENTPQPTEETTTHLFVATAFHLPYLEPVKVFFTKAGLFSMAKTP